MKIISESHLDHGLSQAHIEWILAKFQERDCFFIETVEMPDQLSQLESAIYGPVVGDEPVSEDCVTYKKRGEREGESRLVDRPTRKTRLLTVIAGPNGEAGCVLYTAYGGPSAPQEPTDPAIADDPEKLATSKAFWSQHALSIMG
jgi:hypothetical protein